jgi:hypothetical protein
MGRLRALHDSPRAEGNVSYSYEKLRPKVFTEDGQVMFLKIRDNAKALIKQAGAVSAAHLWDGCTGDSWTMMACIDRLVELKELVEVPNPISSWGQHRIFIDGSERP